jgi:hypothetical protein
MARLFAFALVLLIVAPDSLANEPTLPRPGDHGLRVLSPTVLEIEIITEHGMPSGPLAGIFSDDFRASLPAPERFDVRANAETVAVKSVGAKRRALYAPLRENDIRVGNWLYLELARPLAEWAKVEVRTRTAERPPDAAPEKMPPLWPDDFIFLANFAPDRLSPAIHVNQVSYAPAFPKVAQIGYYLGDLGELLVPTEGFEIRDSRTQRIVHRGQLSRRADRGFKDSPLPYQHVWQADFSALQTPGSYQLFVPGLGASRPFLIHEGAFMAIARTYALGLYHQRCGAPNELPFTRHTHPACHLAPAEVPATAADFGFTWKLIGELAAEKRSGASTPSNPFTGEPSSQLYPFVNVTARDVSGGHHDAGDYSKYTANSAALVHHLVFAVDAFPGIAALDNLGLPESGDGIPDLLQIAKWEADFLAKLQDDDGGFYFLVYPRERRYESNVLPDAGDPQVVWPKNTAVTAAAVAALAQSASSPHFKKYFPDDAARYLAQARRGWEFLMRALETHGREGAYQRLTHYGDNFTHDDEIAWAACELFLATGDAAFQRELFRWMPEPGHARLRRWGWQRLSDGWGNAKRSYAFAARSGRLARSQLDGKFLRLCEGELLSAGDDALARSQASAYGTAFPLETKRHRGGGWYFSLDFAMDMVTAHQLEPRKDYLAALIGNLNYEAGANPLNRVFLTGLGHERQREIVHQYSHNDRRALPPSGLPLGNLIAGQPHHAPSKLPLRMLSYPDDGAAAGAYPLYDRWSDVHNVSAEFIVTNQARGLIAAAFLASLTPQAKQPWRAAKARIVLSQQKAQLDEPLTARLEITDDPSLGLAEADIIWEARGQEPMRARNLAFTPRSGGAHWIEAEAVWPDGRRVFAATELAVVSPYRALLDDALPDGAAPSGQAKGWQWVTNDPAPFSGSRALQTGDGTSGTHEFIFPRSNEPLAVSGNDVLFAHVWIDPAHPPREIMIAWNDGASWSHRAYWGENLLAYGRNGTPSQWRVGNLPQTGEWVRLDVLARTVDLGGKKISGLSLSAVDGRVVWDLLGVRSHDAPAPRAKFQKN